MALRKHLKNIHHMHIKGRNLKSIVGETWDAMVSFHHEEEEDMWLSQQQQMHHKLKSHCVAKAVRLSDGSSLS